MGCPELHLTMIKKRYGVFDCVPSFEGRYQHVVTGYMGSTGKTTNSDGDEEIYLLRRWLQLRTILCVAYTTDSSSTWTNEKSVMIHCLFSPALKNMILVDLCINIANSNDSSRPRRQ